MPEGALPFWKERLTRFGLPFWEEERFGESYIRLDDPHGLRIELVERAAGKTGGWTFGGVSPEVAIKGFGGVTLYSGNPRQTADVLTQVMGLEPVAHEGDYSRFMSSADIGNVIDLKTVAGRRGSMGPGTVHHVAWRATDRQEQLQWREHVLQHGLRATDVKDRHYFDAIYFPEPGGILFEIATDPPGFTVDETARTLGERLMLPPQYEELRDELEGRLPGIHVRPLEK